MIEEKGIIIHRNCCVKEIEGNDQNKVIIS